MQTPCPMVRPLNCQFVELPPNDQFYPTAVPKLPSYAESNEAFHAHMQSQACAGGLPYPSNPLSDNSRPYTGIAETDLTETHNPQSTSMDTRPQTPNTYINSGFQTLETQNTGDSES